MAARILYTIKNKDELVGFRAISKKYGIENLNLKQAEQRNKEERYENVYITPEGRWKGVECSIERFPVLDASLNVVKCEATLFILNKVMHKGSLIGFRLMNVNGEIGELDIKNTIAYAQKYGLINATLVDRGGNIHISALPNKELREKEYKPKLEDKTLNTTAPVVDTKVQSEPNVKSRVDDSKIKRIHELVPLLKKACDVYEQGKDEIMSNFEYDKLYDELVLLENETGLILPDSVTQRVGAELQSKLEKVTHKSKMLSLDKTKDVSELTNSLGGQPGFLGWKLDGLTLVLTYEDGKLVSAVTRGNGNIGENVTKNYLNFKNARRTVNYKDRLVVRGEALIDYATFERINSEILDVNEQYKNPRNLCSGTVRQLDTAVTKQREPRFVLFGVIEGFDECQNYTEKLDKSRDLGFEVVEYVKVTKDNVAKAVEYFKEKVKSYKYPTDGLVISIDNIAYGDMLGTTGKHPRNAKAFKWEDELKGTPYNYTEWSNSRTGAINPVGVFEPIELEGTTVTRASLHNVSYFESLCLGKGDIVTVYKANMIIPQINENLTKSGTEKIPTNCPICKSQTEIKENKGSEGKITKVLYCPNPDCTAKHIGNLTHFVTRDAMNIDGLSESTIERLVNIGAVKDYVDFYHIEDYKSQIISLDGFGKRSYEKLYNAIEKSREVDLHSFINALGIEQMGRTTSKLICTHFDYDLESILNSDFDTLKKIDGVGDKTAEELIKYFNKNSNMVRQLAREMKFKEAPKVNKNSSIAGKIFCITGDVYKFKNRKELQQKIESLGAKAASSVSAKTNYLINNDNTSQSNKNQDAKKYGVPLITEDEFIKMIED